MQVAGGIRTTSSLGNANKEMPTTLLPPPPPKADEAGNPVLLVGMNEK